MEKSIKAKKLNKPKTDKSLFGIIACIFLAAYALSLILPLGWALMNSLKGRLEFSDNPFAWPEQLLFKNYKDAFSILSIPIETAGGTRYANFFELTFNTVAYSLGSTFMGVLSPCITAYVVAKYKFKLRGIIYGIVIVTMLLPIVGSLPSEMNIIRALGFYDNIFGIWITKGSFLGLNFLIFYASFKSFAWDYAEAAFIDGASHIKVFLKIMLPLARTTILALALLAFIGFWNEYQTQLLYLPSMPSLSYGLLQFQFSVDTKMTIPIQLAGCMMASLPVLLLYLAFKNLLIGNIAVGGIKG